MEQYANNASTTLNGAIDNSTTSVVVSSATGFPSSGDFRIKIDNEIMLVTGVSGTTFTVTRGVESTAAASHGNGVDVHHILTKASLLKLIEESIGLGAHASRPSAGRAGAIYIANDVPLGFRDTGSVWSPFGPIFTFTKPTLSTTLTTKVTSGSADLAITDNKDRSLVEATSTSGSSMCTYVQSAPSTPYTIEMGAYFGMVSKTSGTAIGIGFRDSGTSRQRVLFLNYNGTNLLIAVLDHTNLTTFSATPFSMNAQFTPLNQFMFFKIEDDGTDHRFKISFDGMEYITLLKASRTAFVATPNQVGVFLTPPGTTTGDSNVFNRTFLNVLHWKQG